MPEGQGLNCAVDLVLCIDSTASMRSIIDRVKANAIKLYDDLMKALEEHDRNVSSVRVRVIPFRDTRSDGAGGLEASDFFVLPQAHDEFASYVNGIAATGGGDAPESGLAALAVAMHSDWTSEEARQRHIVVLWTDAPAHSLEEGGGTVPSQFSSQVPANFDGLTDLWEGSQDAGTKLKPNARRLVLYAPDSEIWNTISDAWENTVHYQSRAGDGLADVDYGAIISAIAESV